VKNWPGIPETTGQAIIDKLWQQVKDEGVSILYDSVERVDFGVWPFIIYTTNGLTLHAMSVIIATGAEAKKLEIPGEKVDSQDRVSVCAICEAHMFEGLDVVVVGGGDAAIVEALQLSPYARTV